MDKYEQVLAENEVAQAMSLTVPDDFEALFCDAPRFKADDSAGHGKSSDMQHAIAEILADGNVTGRRARRVRQSEAQGRRAREH